MISSIYLSLLIILVFTIAFLIFSLSSLSIGFFFDALFLPVLQLTNILIGNALYSPTALSMDSWSNFDKTILTIFGF